MLITISYADSEILDIFYIFYYSMALLLLQLPLCIKKHQIENFQMAFSIKIRIVYMYLLIYEGLFYIFTSFS